ncbi:MAG TPA: glycoside hydrolase family 20 zincin-like fold domain-containing protein, partial [Hanamia sp.]|nr:glycoside hydrolase family 20 zincin-like fold domain-containing protein [Hanamia sp.]
MNVKAIKEVFKKVLFFIILACFELSSNAARLPHPSLIPLPQNVKWTNENFILKNCKAILTNDVSLKNLAVALEKITNERLPILFKPKSNLPFIELKLEKINAASFSEEAYKLEVSKNRISVLANSPHGIFNGLQT